MRRLLFITTILLVILKPNDHSAQTDLELTKQNIIEQRLEIIASSVDESVEVDYTNLFESLSYFFEHPINLNRANPDDLRELYLLTDLQINALQNHISKFGSLKSIYELQSIRGFDLVTIRNIQPFVTVVAGGMMDGLTWKNLFKEGRSDIFLRYRRTVQQQAGFIPDTENNEPAAYVGTPNYMYTRYRFTYRRNLSVGFTLENDAGESLKNGPDFYSAHLFIRNEKRVKVIALGDYQAQFGQGLTFWNGLGFGKSPFVMNVKKNAQGLRPYTSVNESLYLRGEELLSILAKLM
ncbi:MAG: helix-hairpin-helix domain-containing protein [Flavobacteriales bacterium]